MSRCTSPLRTHARNVGGWRCTTHDCDRPARHGPQFGARRTRQECRRTRPGRHPARRRLRRRHAAHRQPVHQRDGVLRQRPLDVAQLPRRDPRADGHPAGRQLLPAALRRPRHHDAGRRPRRARGHEPGRSEGQHRRPPRRRAADRRLRRVQRAQPREGRLRRQPARGRLPGGLADGQRAAHQHDARRALRLRPRQEGGRAQQEHVHARAAVVDVPPADRGHGPLPRAPVPPQARDRRGQHRRVPRRVQLRRDHRGLRRLLRDQAGPDGTGPVPQHLRQPGAVAGPRRGRPALGPAAVPRRLPDHAGVGHPPRAVQAQGLRRAHVPGRGRDRRDQRGHRRRVRRCPRRDDDVRAGCLAEVRGAGAGGDDRAAAARRRRAARRAVDRPADQDRAVGPAAGDVRSQR